MHEMKINGTGEKLKRFVASLLLSVASLHTRVNIVTSFISSPRTLKEETIEVFKLEEKKYMNPFFLGMNAHQIAELLMPFSSLVSQYQVSGRTTFTLKKVCQNVTDFVRCHVFPRVCLETTSFEIVCLLWKKNFVLCHSL